MLVLFPLIAVVLIVRLVWTKLAKKAVRSSIYLFLPLLMFSCHVAGERAWLDVLLGAAFFLLGGVVLWVVLF
jgi:hypothetical protein